MLVYFQHCSCATIELYCNFLKHLIIVELRNYPLISKRSLKMYLNVKFTLTKFAIFRNIFGERRYVVY